MSFVIIKGDITQISADAIVNTANPKPVYGRGVDAAVYQCAGADVLLNERKKLGNIRPGSAVVTSALGLKAKYIIHTAGPIWHGGMLGERRTLRHCYRNSLRLAASLKCESIAFPLISAGTNKFPGDLALKIAISEIRDFLNNHEMEIMLVVYTEEILVLSDKIFNDLEGFIDRRRNLAKEDAGGERSEEPAGSGQNRPMGSSVLVDRRKADRPEESFVPADEWEADRPEESSVSADEWGPDWPEESSVSADEWGPDWSEDFFAPSAGGRFDGAQAPPPAAGRRRKNRAESAAPAPSGLHREEREAPAPSGTCREEREEPAPSGMRREEREAPVPSGMRRVKGKAPIFPALSGADKAGSFSDRRRDAGAAPPSFGGQRADAAAPSSPSHSAKRAGSAEPPLGRRNDAGFEASVQAGKPYPSSIAGSAGRKRSLDDVIAHVSETFQEKLFRTIMEKGYEDPDVYKRANIDRKLFSKIRNDRCYQPKKNTAVALCLALRLNLDETKDLLARAGYAFSPSSLFDLIIEYFIENEVYDVMQINLALFAHDQPLLGS